MSYSLGTEGTQNIAGDFLAHYDGDVLQKRRQLQMLKADLNILDKRIEHHTQQGTQDEQSMAERDQVVKYIKDVEKEIKEKYGAQGGRRKKHRRTKRHSKSRRSKSRRSKSRRSKSRRSKH